MDVLVGTTVSHWVDFETPTGLVVADTNTVTFRLYDTAGNSLAYDLPAGADPGKTGVSIQVTQEYHLITAPRRFEKRALFVRWTTGGQSHQIRRDYRVIPFTLYTATPEAVRAFLGLNEDELRDEEVDLFAAFLDVETEIGQSRLNDALTSGTRLEQLGNQAIAMTAALAALPSAQLRTLMSVSDGSNIFARFRNPPDFTVLERTARRLRGEAMAALAGRADVSPTLVAFSEPTNAITG